MTQAEDFVQEQRNYFRLVNLVQDVGTDVMRESILQHLTNGETLDSVLWNNRVKSRLDYLVSKGKMSKCQWKILYPSDHPGEKSVNLLEIDITLWFSLLHNLILNQDNNKGQKYTWVDDVMDIKSVRNELFHSTKPELDNDRFNRLWNKVTVAIKNLDHRIENCDSYKTLNIDKDKVAMLRQHISEQVLKESNARQEREISHLRLLVKCMFALFLLICIALVLSAFLIIYFMKASTPCQKYRHYNSTSAGVMEFVERRGWGAEPPKSDIQVLTKPANLVIYSHTADSRCQTPDQCCLMVKNIQRWCMYQRPDRLADISYHFLIDTTGLIYEGRSLDYKHEVVKYWNNHSISIAMIGNYMYEKNISGRMIEAFVTLLDWLKESKFLTKDYLLYGQCEVAITLSPGKYLYKYVMENKDHFPNAVRRNDSKCEFKA